MDIFKAVFWRDIKIKDGREYWIGVVQNRKIICLEKIKLLTIKENEKKREKEYI